MRIIFCGAGALGSHALFLARDFEHDLAVIDFDRRTGAARWAKRENFRHRRSPPLLLMWSALPVPRVSINGQMDFREVIRVSPLRFRPQLTSNTCRSDLNA